MAITTSSNLPAPILQSLAPGMLSVPTPNFNYIVPAEKYSMPRQGGTTMRFLRPVALVPPVVQLGNSGIEPASQVAQREIIDAAMAFYGTSAILNEQAIIQDQDPVLSWVTERLGVAMRQAEDIILRDFLLASAGQYNCKGGVNGDNPNEMTVRDLSNVGAVLDTENAFKFEQGIGGENKFGTSPVRSAYMLLINTMLQPTFDAMPQFTSSWNYPSMQSTTIAEYGSVLNFRIYTSSQSALQLSASMNGNTVYNNMAVARQAYGHIDQDGYSSQLIYRPPIYSGPLALNGTLGVKFAQAQALLQSTWIRNVRCTQIS